jgi:hypothetical protein
VLWRGRDLSGDGELERDLEARGWNTGTEWDGEIHRLPKP